MKRMTSLFIVSLMAALSPTGATLTGKGLDKNLFTSDFMIGNVVVAIIFPESDGTRDKNTESWSEDRKTQVLSKIMAGLDWWTRQNPRSPLSFTFVTDTVPTKYEPITRPYYDESLWIPDVMEELGFKGSRFTSTRDYVNTLRTKHKADWGFIMFVVDSLNDSNGKFADGLFAYAYLGGPFMVMTYDNNGYGISNMDVVVAHETGHVFHALDQYAGASGPNDYSRGYFPTQNRNHAYSSEANEPNSIMRGGLRWGLDEWSKIMVGWNDTDGNNKDDIVDQVPLITLASDHAVLEPSGAASFEGETSVTILPRQGSAIGWGLTLDTIAKVEYRLKKGEWVVASPADGGFDGAIERFGIFISPSAISSAQSITAQDVDVRVTTSYSTKTGSSDGSSFASVPTSLQDAHPFPNPFKPNSDVGHSYVTFTGLTSGAKVQVFTPAGEPVFDLTAPPLATNVRWYGVDDKGKAIASGIYFFLISDSEGQKKEGKIAVIK